MRKSVLSRMLSFNELRKSVLACLLTTVLLLFGQAYGQDLQHASKWDAGLLQLELRGIRVKADSLGQAWQGISSQTGARTVFFSTRETFSSKRAFDFERKKSSLAELLNAFTNTYPDLTYSLDKKTKIIWIHPASIQYEDILSAVVKVEKSAEAVPMLSGVFQGVGSFRSLGLVRGGRSNILISNTFDCPINVPAGVYPVRDIINVCCLASPQLTFFISTERGGICSATPLTVVPFSYEQKMENPTPGSIYFWQTDVNGSSQGVPSATELIEALASTNTLIRLAARNYVWMNQSLIPLDSLAQTAPRREAVWVSLASLSFVDRVEQDGPIAGASIMELEKRLKEVWPGDPGLKALAAVELASLARNTNFLSDMAGKSLSERDLAGVRYDLIRVLRSSQFIRSFLSELNPPWAGFSKADIAALGQAHFLPSRKVGK